MGVLWINEKFTFAFTHPHFTHETRRTTITRKCNTQIHIYKVEVKLENRN